MLNQGFSAYKSLRAAKIVGQLKTYGYSDDHIHRAVEAAATAASDGVTEEQLLAIGINTAKQLQEGYTVQMAKSYALQQHGQAYAIMNSIKSDVIASSHSPTIVDFAVKSLSHTTSKGYENSDSEVDPICMYLETERNQFDNEFRRLEYRGDYVS